MGGRRAAPQRVVGACPRRSCVYARLIVGSVGSDATQSRSATWPRARTPAPRCGMMGASDACGYGRCRGVLRRAGPEHGRGNALCNMRAICLRQPQTASSAIAFAPPPSWPEVRLLLACVALQATSRRTGQCTVRLFDLACWHPLGAGIPDRTSAAAGICSGRVFGDPKKCHGGFFQRNVGPHQAGLLAPVDKLERRARGAGSAQQGRDHFAARVLHDCP